jgi:hypothetical protein
MWWEQKEMSTMKTPRLKTVTPHTPGFNITIRPETNLGNTMLILEDEEATTNRSTLHPPSTNSARWQQRLPTPRA